VHRPAAARLPRQPQRGLRDWAQFGSSTSNVASIRFRLNVTFGTGNKRINAGSGLDRFWYTNTHDGVNRKPTDLRN
jgi:hypothetical protein